MPQAPAEFPLTLAEVLYQELYGDLISDEETKAAALLNEQVVADRKTAHEKAPEPFALEGSNWFTAAEQSDWELKQEASRQIVPTIYRHIREKPARAALCLSGGGVRSAIFNFGILQGLARQDLLDKFDYLSTVSGGGFIGSWLTAWINRSGLKNVITELKRRRGGTDLKTGRVGTPLRPEPEPVYNLRIYANYLTPRKGLSVDTFTLAAVYLRNLLLNWLVFVPVLVAFLMLPRISVAIVRSSYVGPDVCLYVGFVAAALALVYIGINLPDKGQFNWRERWFVIFCLVPLVISSIALTTYWVRVGAVKPGVLDFGWFALKLAIVSWVTCVIVRIVYTLRGKDETGLAFDGRTMFRLLLGTILIFGAFLLTGLVTGYLVRTELSDLNLLHGGARLYATLAVPLLLVMLTIGGTLIAGLTSQFTHSDDQEWWARSGGWILLIVVGWALFHLLVLFGPSLFMELQAQATNQKNWAGVSVKGVGTVVVGIVSGIITLMGGFSPKTEAHGGTEKPAGLGSQLLPLITIVAAAIFAIFIVIVLALISDWILASDFGNWASVRLHGPSLRSLGAGSPRSIIYASPGRLLVALAALIAAVGTVLGWCINTNKFSLHYYWRNRMMRAYLGASRKEQGTNKGTLKKDRGTTKNLFTDFDMADDLRMHKLKRIDRDDLPAPELKQKPLHVLVVTLNLVGGSKLEWQDRKAESFTISPWHVGSYWLGYRDAKQYGGAHGISLATAAAISGAAASPNMGFMMTSPIVRVLMTLFNIRMGFWLGNPGAAGNKHGRFGQTYDQASRAVRYGQSWPRRWV